MPNFSDWLYVGFNVSVTQLHGCVAITPSLSATKDVMCIFPLFMKCKDKTNLDYLKAET